MAQKYVATIMNRLFLGDENFIFYVSHPAIGEYDPKTKIFKDRNGVEYLPINDPHLMISEISTAYANLEEMSKIPKKVGQPNMRDAIADYNYYCSRFLYYVSKTEQGLVFCIPLDYIQMKENINKAVDVVSKNGGFEKVSEGGQTFKITDSTASMNPNPQQNPETVKEEKEDEYSFENVVNKAVLSKDVRSDIAAFFMELMEGIYSLEELKAIRENVVLQKEDLETLLDSLDLQIEASEKGESSIQLKDSKTHTLDDTIKADEKSKKIKIENYIDLDSLFQRVTRTLIAQDEPTRRVITEIARKEQNPKFKNRGLLITGPTGSGKTKMMELIAKYLDRPFFKIDATQLTIPGYTGKDIEEALWDLLIYCGKDVEKAEKAIVFFDEIDKKGSSKKDDVSGKGVLNLLLPFIEGSTYNACANMRLQKEIIKINTSNMIVILGGAFTDVYKELKDKGGIGFGAKVGKEATREATTQDFVEKAQMPDEFMGRVSIVKLNELDVDAIKRILLESDESALKIQEKLFEELGVKLTPSEDYINAIANQAVKRETGARGLNTVVDETTWEAYGDAYSNLGAYEEIILEGETVENPKVYTKIRKKEDNN